MNNENKNKKIVIIVLFVLIVGNIFFAIKYFKTRTELKVATVALSVKETNEKIVSFNELFIEKVLNSTGEIEFETRLSLENAVRELGDEEILNQWKNFTNSKTEKDAQQEVKNLLNLLADKITSANK